jgi:hypothetical protein
MIFKRFKKIVPEIPKSELIEQSPFKDKYLIRLTPWDWLTKTEIYIMSHRDGKPAMITMDPNPVNPASKSVKTNVYFIRTPQLFSTPAELHPNRRSHHVILPL